MKNLLFVAILIINLNGKTAGLKCYRCNDDYISCDDPYIYPCAFDHDEFCITYFHQGSSKKRFGDCGKDICLSKSCNTFDGNGVFTCKSTGIYEIQTSMNASYSISCCKGDFCNKLNGTELMQLSFSTQIFNQNRLFYVLVLCFLSSLFVLS